MAPTSVDHRLVANVATSQSLITYLTASDREKKKTSQEYLGHLVSAGRASNLSSV